METPRDYGANCKRLLCHPARLQRAGEVAAVLQVRVAWFDRADLQLNPCSAAKPIISRSRAASGSSPRSRAGLRRSLPVDALLHPPRRLRVLVLRRRCTQPRRQIHPSDLDWHHLPPFAFKAESQSLNNLGIPHLESRGMATGVRYSREGTGCRSGHCAVTLPTPTTGGADGYWRVGQRLCGSAARNRAA